MDFIIGFLLGVAAVIGFLHATKGCKPGSKRDTLRQIMGAPGSGGGGGGLPLEPL